MTRDRPVPETPATAAAPPVRAAQVPLVERRWWFVPALVASVAIGVGLLELPAAFVRRELFLQPIEGDAHLPWMAALANLVLLLPLGALLMAAHLRWPGPRVERIATTILFALGTYALLLYLPGLQHWALAVLSIGVAARLSAVAMRRRERFHRLLRRSALTSSSLAAASAIAAFAWTPVREWSVRRGLRDAAAGAPNVLLLVLDTVRAANLGLYGYARATSPSLEQWATSGTVFTHAVATASWTLPSHAGMFTGRWVHELNAGFKTPLDDRWPTLAEALAERGYATAGFTANRKFVSYEHGLGRGFARFEDFRVSPGQIAASSALARQIIWRPWFQDLIGYHDLYGRKNAAMVNAELLRWLSRRDAHRPFFAFLNYYDAHDPYLPPPPFDLRFAKSAVHPRSMDIERKLDSAQITRARDAYDGAIAYLDQQIGELLGELERRGQLANTLLIITSDHGEQFGEHGMLSHGNTLYRPLLDVPLLLRMPGRVPTGRRIDARVTLRDLPATVLDLTQSRDVNAFPGSSLASLWREPAGPNAPRTSPILSELTWPNGQIAFSLREDRYSFIDWFQERRELYDLADDPAESKNLIPRADRARDARAMRVELDSVVGRIDRPREMPRIRVRLQNLLRGGATGAWSAHGWGRR